ncbi:MAG: hypothetical protein ACI857_000113 [Arenicella sp.]|jgi:hypothetical protein
MGSIGLLDITFWMVYFILITFVLWMYKNTKTQTYYKYFLPAFFLKVFGGVLFAVIYVYYYQFGDTFLYDRGAYYLSEVLIDSPSDYIRLLASTHAELPPDLNYIAQKISYSATHEEWFMVKLLSPLSLIAGRSYLVLTLFMSTISFWGCWKLFKVFSEMMPKRIDIAFISVFAVPTLIFWGGGIMKDTATLACFCYLLFALYQISKKRTNFWLILGIVICSLIIFKLKAYVIIAFLPSVFIVLYFRVFGRSDSQLVKYFVRPFMLSSTISLALITLRGLAESSEKYNADGIQGKIHGFHTWHTTQGGSVYSLGEIEYTATGIISKIPAALNVTFFRPYVWEVSSIVQYLTALESLFLSVFFILILWWTKLRFFKYLGMEPFLSATFLYVLIFGFAVGFTSYNFGALARYKIPILSLFVFSLFYVYHKYRETKDAKN